MWFMNHVFNPIMRWLLTSPFQKWVNKDTLLISFRGRKSGKEYITPVNYVHDEKTVWIIVGYPEKKQWWRNLVGGAEVRLYLEGTWVNGHAFLLQGEQDRQGIVEGLRRMVKKYPRAVFGQYSLDDPNFKVEGNMVVRVDIG